MESSLYLLHCMYVTVHTSLFVLVLVRLQRDVTKTSYLDCVSSYQRTVRASFYLTRTRHYLTRDCLGKCCGWPQIVSSSKLGLQTTNSDCKRQVLDCLSKIWTVAILHKLWTVKADKTWECWLLPKQSTIPSKLGFCGCLKKSWDCCWLQTKTARTVHSPKNRKTDFCESSILSRFIKWKNSGLLTCP